MKARLKNPQPNQQTKIHSFSESSGATFSDHIVELRRRAMWIGLCLILCSALAYNYHDVLLKVIMAPLHGEKLIYLTPGGGFSFIFLISMYAGLLATIPVLIYHLHAFIKPALPLRARRSALKIILAATLLITGGVTYGYFIAIPAALQFLTTFAGDAVTPSLTAESYLNFFLAYVAGLAVLSLLPLILMFAHWIKPLKPGGLLRSERWVFLFAFVAAALITPTPDVVNQAMIALPVIGIYQLGVVAVIIATLHEKRSKKQFRIDSSAEVKSKPHHALVASPAPRVIPSVTMRNPSVAGSVPGTTLVIQKETPHAQPKPTRIVRSMDGFRSLPPAHVASRESSRQRSTMYPPRRSLDGVIAPRTRMPQN